MIITWYSHELGHPGIPITHWTVKSAPHCGSSSEGSSRATVSSCLSAVWRDCQRASWEAKGLDQHCDDALATSVFVCVCVCVCRGGWERVSMAWAGDIRLSFLLLDVHVSDLFSTHTHTHTHTHNLASSPVQATPNWKPGCGLETRLLPTIHTHTRHPLKVHEKRRTFLCSA